MKVTIPSVYTSQNYIKLERDGSNCKVTIVFGLSNLTVTVRVQDIVNALKVLFKKGE